MSKFDRSKLALSITLLLSSGTVLAEQQVDEQETIEKIQVTGSRIARTSAEMTTPTTVLNAKTMQLPTVLTLLMVAVTLQHTLLIHKEKHYLLQLVAMPINIQPF
ncbi:hypothetical protein ACSLBF_04480 [Pseudoalteromonas sp. T1lg65]|uniref:hypothetical protein n=1 Tax=Pseudoalteromonas sp. T1lg65 TaxID=2077101 RepID=UPI003F79E728